MSSVQVEVLDCSIAEGFYNIIYTIHNIYIYIYMTYKYTYIYIWGIHIYIIICIMECVSGF